MKIIGFGNATGSKSWRLEHPFRYLRERGHEAYVSDEGITEKALNWADVIVFNSVVDKEGIALARYYQKEKGKKIVVDCDDWFDLNPDSPFIKEHEISDAKSVIKITMEIADLVTCTTKYLAKQIEPINKNVKVLPNYLDLEFWDVNKYKNNSNKIRIGWAGSITHLNDLEYIVDPLKKFMDKYPSQLIFVGETRIKDYFKGYPVECVLGVPFEVWPTRLAGLRLDIGLAPLLDTPFNRAKSNIKWLEYAINKIPAIYSPTVYKRVDFEPHLGMIAEDKDHWYRCLEHLVTYPERRKEIGEYSYDYVKKNYSLLKHIEEWENAYNSITDIT